MDIHCELGGRWGQHISGVYNDNDLSLNEKVGIGSTPMPDKNHAIQQLHALLPTRPDVAFLRTDSTFLLRFLRAKKFRVGDAFLLLCHYFEYRQRHRELFRGLNVDGGGGGGGETGIQTALLDGLPGVLSERDPCGRPIIILLASNWDHTKYDIRTVYRAVLLTLEKLVEDEGVQAAGVVAILDWSNFPARLTTTLSPKLLRLMLDGLQDAFPLRLGGLHLINQPWYVEAALGLARPFLKEKLRSRIHYHGNNLATLHAQVPPRLLPAELGGECGEYHAHTWAATMLNHTHRTPTTPKSPDTTVPTTPTSDKTLITNSQSYSALNTTILNTSNKTLNTSTSSTTFKFSDKTINTTTDKASDKIINSPTTPESNNTPQISTKISDLEQIFSNFESHKSCSPDSQSTPLVTKDNTVSKPSKSLASLIFGASESEKSANGNASEGEETILKAH